MQRFTLRNLVLVILSAVVLAACGSSGTPTAPSAAEIQPTQTSPTSAPVATGAPTDAPTEVPPTEMPTQAPAVASEVSFTADVLPILNENCSRCHGDTRQRADLMLNSYEAVMAGAGGSAIVVPGDADDGDLMKVITTGEMPKDSDPLSQEAIQIIRDWINQGALNN